MYGLDVRPGSSCSPSNCKLVHIIEYKLRTVPVGPHLHAVKQPPSPGLHVPALHIFSFEAITNICGPIRVSV